MAYSLDSSAIFLAFASDACKTDVRSSASSARLSCKRLKIVASVNTTMIVEAESTSCDGDSSLPYAKKSIVDGADSTGSPSRIAASHEQNPVHFRIVSLGPLLATPMTILSRSLDTDCLSCLGDIARRAASSPSYFSKTIAYSVLFGRDGRMYARHCKGRIFIEILSRQVTCYQLVEDDTERVDVSANIHRNIFSRKLLWAHILKRANDHASSSVAHGPFSIFSRALANPKSMTMAVAFPSQIPTRMFDGLISR